MSEFSRRATRLSAAALVLALAAACDRAEPEGVNSSPTPTSASPVASRGAEIICTHTTLTVAEGDDVIADGVLNNEKLDPNETPLQQVLGGAAGKNLVVIVSGNTQLQAP